MKRFAIAAAFALGFVLGAWMLPTAEELLGMGRWPHVSCD